MSIVELFETLAHAMTVLGVFILIYQLHLLLKQRRHEAFLRNYETNRELIKMGVETPHLLNLLQDEGLSKNVDEYRYMQLWTNHVHLAYVSYCSGLFSRKQWDVMSADIASFFRLPAMIRHWETAKAFYPDDYRSFVDALIDK